MTKKDKRIRINTCREILSLVRLIRRKAPDKAAVAEAATAARRLTIRITRLKPSRRA